MSMGDTNIFCAPINVEAFILNEKVCDEGGSRIAPITQPDYRGLRLNSSEIKHDILPYVDLSRTQPATVNSRVTAVEDQSATTLSSSPGSTDQASTGRSKERRLGVYIHWSLPRLYRAATGGASGTDELPTKENISPEPTFRMIPNRWLVVRSIRDALPGNAIALGRTQAWVVESDRLWTLDELGPDVDLEVDVSPYVMYKDGDESSPDVLNNQTKYYIGAKIPASSWEEKGNTVPRIPLTTMNSGNILFADNSAHNPNVLSMVDNLQFVNISGRVSKYTKATCDYTVVGWHSNLSDDPVGRDGLKGSFKERLRALFLETSPDWIEKNGRFDRTWSRLACHGTVYNVPWNRNLKPFTPADEYAKLFTANITMEPISVGTTALDSVLTFLQAHKANSDVILGSGSSELAADILNLSELLYAMEDGYDGRVKASDIIDAHNFQREAGGVAWQYDEKAERGKPALTPSSKPDESGYSETQYLRKVNDLQAQIDAAERKLKHMQWSLFSVWWNFISDPNGKQQERLMKYKDGVVKFREIIKSLTQQIWAPDTGLQAQVSNIVRAVRPVAFPRLKARKIARPAFFHRKDPTVCIAGIDSGWPTEYLGKLHIRVLSQSPYYFQFRDQPPVVRLASTGDPGLDTAIKVLVGEAVTTQDHGGILGFKSWVKQPWCPLFLEWEAIYYHIPIEKWSVELVSSPIGNNHSQVRYMVKEPLYNDLESTEDVRTVSGRILVLPQPVFNLQAILAQVLSVSGTDLPPELETVEQRDAFIKAVGTLDFISGELDGLTTNLLTLKEGSHVPPNFTVPGNPRPVPLEAAVLAGVDIGISREDLMLIRDQTAATPYGTLEDFSTATSSPFKGATHGQLRFTKLNMIDKFGQAISAIPAQPPLRIPSDDPETIYPCLGDQVCPTFVPGTTLLNTVTPLTLADPQLPGAYPLCPYIQLPPAINQNSRLNASFLVKEISLTNANEFVGWRTVSDYEQPIWGWIIINYANQGLQFFTSEGSFYVELTLGGPTDTIASAKWLPFDPPTPGTADISPQLDQLITTLTGSDGGVYLRSFYNMVTQAVETMPFAPPEYAASATAIIGKPLALVNVGFSLELATEPLSSQTTLPPTLNNTISDADILYGYKFPIKIGDAERPFDGVVGYFDTDNSTTGSTNWTKLHTYFTAGTLTGEPILPPPSPVVGDPRQLIEPDVFPTLSPYYIDPLGPLKGNSFEATHASKFLVKTMIVDPYTPLHVYTPILPVTELKLSAWTVQKALYKISAFFTLGPMLITRDIPHPYDEEKPLTPSTWLEIQRSDLKPDSDSATIRLPIIGGAASAKGVWNWLQPYSVGDTEESEETKYNALDVGQDDGRLRLDEGPYTMVEGFLQLFRRLEKGGLGI
ncbi:hypothetical protein M501DRAFT_954904 [Patellaria atrata CBS 101060]|uniref:Uncharacterized protein n=1 Tax=Patellaria atrata CBS 101060 TaxID=1346257 RepID=A0A9P4SBH5_9PEZI|nr:hypothetical protein M501DRAFT_954904 [Patellaria atrata CBS 101060]